MSDFVLRPIHVADLPGVLAIQSRCYGDALIESVTALASRVALSPDTCWVATYTDGTLAAYLLTHAWPASRLPPLDGHLVRDWPDDTPRVWFVHDMAVAPEGRGTGIAARLFEAARAAALAQGLAVSRLIAVQSAAPWWRRLGYAPVEVQDEHAAKLAAYGEDAVVMECRLDAAG